MIRRLSRRCALPLLALFLVAGLCAAPAVGQEAGSALDPMAAGLGLRERLDRLIERVKLEQSRLETMKADFVQKKVSSLLVEPESSAGSFLYRAPEQVRWEYSPPHPKIVTISGEILTTWYIDLERAERMEIGRYSEEVFKYLGAGGSLETLMKYFSVTAEFPEADGDHYRLYLNPRYKRVRKRLASMEVWIHPTVFLPSKVRYVEPNGDETDYEFSEISINVEIEDEQFEVELPSGVEVTAVSLSSG